MYDTSRKNYKKLSLTYHNFFINTFLLTQRGEGTFLFLQKK